MAEFRRWRSEHGPDEWRIHLDLRRFDDQAGRILHRSQREPEALGLSAIVSPALLLALLDEPATSGSRALIAAGLDRDGVLAAMKECLGDRPLVLADRPVTLVTAALERALEEADRRGSALATADDLIAGLLVQRASLAVEVIAHLGGDVDALLQEVSATRDDRDQG